MAICIRKINMAGVKIKLPKIKTMSEIKKENTG